MKTIKFFSFAMLFALAFVSCKDAATASTETATETLTAEALAATKTTVTENLTGLQALVASKITEIETALTTASEDVKVDLTTQLETYKKFQTELQSASTKVAESTVENWAAVSAEVETIHSAVKAAVTGGAATNETTK
jgi:hypothetical protein